MRFLEIDSQPGEQSAYNTQRQLVELLQAAFEENTKTLQAKEWSHPTELGGLFSYPEDDMPEELRQARRIIDAAGSVWRSLFHGDPVQAAAAGVWFGLMLGPKQFRQYQKRKAEKPRSTPKAQARDLFKSRDHWERAKVFEKAVEKRGIPTTSSRQVQGWFTEFNKS